MGEKGVRITTVMADTVATFPFGLFCFFFRVAPQAPCLLYIDGRGRGSEMGFGKNHLTREETVRGCVWH